MQPVRWSVRSTKLQSCRKKSSALKFPCSHSPSYHDCLDGALKEGRFSDGLTVLVGVPYPYCRRQAVLLPCPKSPWTRSCRPCWKKISSFLEASVIERRGVKPKSWTSLESPVPRDAWKQLGRLVEVGNLVVKWCCSCYNMDGGMWCWRTCVSLWSKRLENVWPCQIWLCVCADNTRIRLENEESLEYFSFLNLTTLFNGICIAFLRTENSCYIDNCQVSTALFFLFHCTYLAWQLIPCWEMHTHFTGIE